MISYSCPQTLQKTGLRAMCQQYLISTWTSRIGGVSLIEVSELEQTVLSEVGQNELSFDNPLDEEYILLFRNERRVQPHAFAEVLTKEVVTDKERLDRANDLLALRSRAIVRLPIAPGGS